MPYTVEYRDWDGTTRAFGAYAEEWDAIDAAAAHYAATGNRAVAIATAPVEPDELALEWTLHQWTDANIPTDSETASAPRFCAFCGTRTTELEWSPIGWVCAGTADAQRADMLAEQQSFYPF